MWDEGDALDLKLTPCGCHLKSVACLGIDSIREHTVSERSCAVCDDGTEKDVDRTRSAEIAS